ncbi:MAG: DUF971 domain-containing protein [Bauldia sp.]
MTAPAPWPTELRLRAGGRVLAVAFDDGSAYDIPAELLRVLSPSAEVQGHGAAERQAVPGKRDVAILRVEPVGNYAIRLVFDDGHATGLYVWDYLAKLGREQPSLTQDYLADLARKGLSRDR